jgi:hypothetical protein
MGKKRQLKRAQAQQSRSATAGKSRSDLRRQTAVERFAKEGSEKLWVALLGWNADRRGRIWLAQAVNDGARARQRDAASFDAGFVVSAFEGHVPSGAKKLDPETAATSVDVWLASGDDDEPGDPGPQWHFLANLSEKLGLGTSTPEALAEEWQAWTSLELASAPRGALMASLAQTEQAATLLHNVTKSDGVGALVNVSRAMWSAVAYGDEATFELLKRVSAEWLSTLGKR